MFRWFLLIKVCHTKFLWVQNTSLSNYQYRLADFSNICCLKISCIWLILMNKFEYGILEFTFFLLINLKSINPVS